MNYRIEIAIDLDEIQQAIYTEGTWHPADNATAWGVSHSNEPIVDRRVREGLDDLLSRISGYIVGKNINFNIESQNILLTLAVERRPPLWPTTRSCLSMATRTASMAPPGDCTAPARCSCCPGRETGQDERLDREGEKQGI